MILQAFLRAGGKPEDLLVPQAIRPVKTTCISFSSPMMVAVLAGTKTQTRRICSHRHGISFLGGQGEWDDPAAWGYAFDGPDHNGYMVLGRGLDERENHGRISLPCPYGVPGDRLTVLEGHTLGLGKRAATYGIIRIRYAADGFLGLLEVPIATYDDLASKVTVQKGRGRPGRFMPRFASRLTLEVTSIRVERVSAISEEDAKAEGVKRAFIGGGLTLTSKHGECLNGTYRDGFRVLWGEINGADSWESWVWCVGFRKVVN